MDSTSIKLFLNNVSQRVYRERLYKKCQKAPFFMLRTNWPIQEFIKKSRAEIKKLNISASQDKELDLFVNFFEDFTEFLENKFIKVFNKVKQRVKPYFYFGNINPEKVKVLVQVNFQEKGIFFTADYNLNALIIHPNILLMKDFEDEILELIIAHEFGHFFDYYTEEIMTKRKIDFNNKILMIDSVFQEKYTFFIKKIERLAEKKFEYQDIKAKFLYQSINRDHYYKHNVLFFVLYNLNGANPEKFGEDAFFYKKQLNGKFKEQFEILSEIKKVLLKLCSEKFISLRRLIQAKRLDQEGFATLFAEKYANDYGLSKFFEKWIQNETFSFEYNTKYQKELAHFGFSPDELITSRVKINMRHIKGLFKEEKELLDKLERLVKEFSDSLKKID